VNTGTVAGVVRYTIAFNRFGAASAAAASARLAISRGGLATFIPGVIGATA